MRLDALGRAAAAAEEPEGAAPQPVPDGCGHAAAAGGRHDGGADTAEARRAGRRGTGRARRRPPPIPYRFIGILSGVPGQGRIAVLTDGRTVVHGKVNDTIEGRYRIVQIGEESLQIEHYDGRGRQTLRLLGQ